MRAVLARTWSGWDVRWAYAGIDDIARYVGEPVEPTDPADRDVSLGPVDLSAPTGAAEFEQLVSVADSGGRTRVYAMWFDVDAFFAGPGLLDRLTDAVPTSTLPFLPESGLYLDPNGRRLEHPRCRRARRRVVVTVARLAAAVSRGPL